MVTLAIQLVAAVVAAYAAVVLLVIAAVLVLGALLGGAWLVTAWRQRHGGPPG